MQYVKSALIALTVICTVALVMAAGHGRDSGGLTVGDFVESAFAFDTAEGNFDRTLNVSGPVELNVRTGSGHIAVHQGSGGAVVVHATVKAHERYGKSAEERLKAVIDHPPIEQNGNTIEIGRFPDDEMGNNVSISYDITAPAQTRLSAHTGSGGQEIDGIAGPVEARAGSGHIRINNIGANVEAHTGSGGIDVNNVQGSLRVSAGSGTIRASNVGASGTGTAPSGTMAAMPTSGAALIEADTGSGGIHLDNVKGRVDAKAGSGHISAQGEMAGEWTLHTGSGGVDVHLPNNAAFDLDAHSSSGGVSVQPPITMSGELSRRDIRGKVRGGGALLQIRTGSGGISVE